MTDEYANGTRWEDADFNNMSWHDCYIHTLGIDKAMPFRTDLVLDLDYICRVTKTSNGTLHIYMAPAFLRFLDVCNVCIRISREDLHIFCIDRVFNTDERDHWTIRFTDSYEQDHRIEFDAAAFVQELRSSPVEVGGCMLSQQQREEMIRQERGQPPTE